MAAQFSVVIVCKNEEDVIGTTLQAVCAITDDVVVYDTGSTDGTLSVVKQYPVQLHQGPWQGFGKTKKLAVQLAGRDWVLNLDADEVPDGFLQQELTALSLQNNNAVYRIGFKNFLGRKHLRWGEWGSDSHIRLFNRRAVNWNEAPVHESLVLPAGASEIKLQGYLLHYTVKDMADYSQKTVRYALLNAENYFAQGKEAGWIKRFLSPWFSFVKNYIFRLGFLDGHEGWVSARMTAFYTFLKYNRLHELRSLTQPKN